MLTQSEPGVVGDGPGLSWASCAPKSEPGVVEDGPGLSWASCWLKTEVGLNSGILTILPFVNLFALRMWERLTRRKGI